MDTGAGLLDTRWQDEPAFAGKALSACSVHRCVVSVDSPVSYERPALSAGHASHTTCTGSLSRHTLRNGARDGRAVPPTDSLPSYTAHQERAAPPSKQCPELSHCVKVVRCPGGSKGRVCLRLLQYSHCRRRGHSLPGSGSSWPAGTEDTCGAAAETEQTGSCSPPSARRWRSTVGTGRHRSSCVRALQSARVRRQG